MGLQLLSFMEFAGNGLGGYSILQLGDFLQNWCKDTAFSYAISFNCILGTKLFLAL